MGGLGFFSMSVKDIPGPRKECSGVKRGPAVPIADMRRLCILENFIKVFESDNKSSK